MATRCPRCAGPTSNPAGTIAGGGRFGRCDRCGNHVYGDGAGLGNGGNALYFGRRASPRIIEGELVNDKDTARLRRPRRPVATPVRAGDSGRLWAGGGIALALLALTAAAPVVASLLTAKKELVLAAVSSKTISVGGAEAVLVEGTLLNRTDEEAIVPAIRVSLREESGAEIHAWLVEPTTERLAPSGSVSFRSIAAAPRSGGHEVTVELLHRHEQIAGMR